MADEKDAIIAEYRVCHDMYVASANRSWQSASLLIGFMLTGAILILTRARPDAKADLWFAIVVMLIGAAVLVTLCFFHKFMRRERWRQSVAIWRMKQIEKYMGRWIVTGVGDLDHWMKKHKKKALQQLSSEAQKLLRKHQAESGWLFIKCLIATAGVIWLFVIGWEWYHHTRCGWFIIPFISVVGILWLLVILCLCCERFRKSCRCLLKRFQPLLECFQRLCKKPATRKCKEGETN